MSKNTRAADFRKVDIDELDEENFRDEETQDEGGDQVSQRESEIKSLMSSYPLILILLKLSMCEKYRNLLY